MSWSHDKHYDRDDVWRELPWEARLEWARDRLPKATRATVADIASCQDVSTRDAFIEGYGHCVDEHDRAE
jgi:hypothetical protein